MGGNYGSPATGEIKDDFTEYMSVTRKEFKEAVNNGIPLFVFIDNKVYAEFGIYEANYEEIEGKRLEIKFRNVKDINVFRFIREIRNIGHISITEFDKVVQIKDFLSKQWSDMFKNYLNSLRNKTPNQKLENTVEEMRSLIQKMDIMLENVGENILKKDDPQRYEHVLQKQDVVAICRTIANCICLGVGEPLSDLERKESLLKLIKALKESISDGIWNKIRSENKEDHKIFFDYFAERNVYLQQITTNFDQKIKDKWELFSDDNNEEMIAEELSKDNYYMEMLKQKD